MVLTDSNGTKWYSNFTFGSSSLSKRDSSIAVPAGLAKYKPAVISSACAMQVKPASSTSVLTVTATVTGAATLTTVSVVATATAPKVDNLIIAVDRSDYGPVPVDFWNYSEDFYANLRNHPPANWPGTLTKAAFNIDPTTGYLEDNLQGGRIAYAYAWADVGDITAVYFTPDFNTFSAWDKEYLTENYKPLVCSSPTSLPATLSCSMISNVDGVNLNAFVAHSTDFDVGSMYISTAGNPLVNQYPQFYAWSTLTLLS
jgi:hypothetical protein